MAGVASLLFAACGSTSSGSAGAQSTGSSAASTANSANGNASSGAAQYQKDLAAYTGVPSFKAPGPAVDASKAKGKTILAIVNDEKSDALVEALHGVQAGGAAAGLNVKVFNANAAVTNVEQGIQQGINDKVAAIITIGVSSNTITGSLASAKKADIPVIAIVGQVPVVGAPGQGGGPDIYAGDSFDYPVIAKLTAENAILHSNGTVHAAIVGFPNSVSDSEVTAIKSVLGACTKCKVLKTDSVPIPQWSTTLPTLTESLIREYPDLNAIFVTADTMSIFTATGVQVASATGKVFVYTMDGTPGAPLKLVQGGTVVLDDPGGSSTWMGWEGVDQALRAILNMQPGNPFVPFRYLDASNLKGQDVTSSDALYGTAYVAGYKSLWGV